MSHTRPCLPTTASSGRKGCSSSPSIFNSRIAISSGTSRTGAHALVPHTLGLHGSGVRAGFSEDRENRAAAPFGRVSRRHAVSDAGRRSAAGTARHRGRCPRSAPSSCGAAAAAGRDRSQPECRARGPDASGDPRVHGGQRGGKRRRSGHARSRGAAHTAAARERIHRGVCVRAAGPRRRMPRRPAGRPRRQLHPDGAAGAGVHAG